MLDNNKITLKSDDEFEILSIRLPKVLKNKFSKQCDENCTMMSKVVRRFIEKECGDLSEVGQK